MAFLDQVDHPIGERNIELEFGMKLEKFRDERRNVRGGERMRRVDAQRSGGIRSRLSPPPLGLLELLQNLRALLVIPRAGFGQAKAAGGALQQAHPQAALEAIDVLGDRGSRQAE